MPHEEYKDLKCLFDLAEAKLKQVEHLVDKLDIPSINELRYAGHHCVNALMANDSAATKAEITEAESHCKRAIYDAMEIGILYLLSKIRMFKEDYRLVPVATVIPSYVEYLVQIRKIQACVAAVPRRNKEENFGLMQEHFTELTVISDVLEVARPELNKTLSLWRTGVYIGLATLILTGLSILVTYLLS